VTQAFNSAKMSKYVTLTLLLTRKTLPVEEGMAVTAVENVESVHHLDLQG
jgi:hypothetical protein